jgi:signal transduction histidine kinase
VRITLEPVPISQVFADVTPIVASQADAKRVTLEVPPISDRLRATADRHRLEQILINVIGNAIKFTPDGGTVRVDCLHDGDGNVTIRVRDTGVGIPADRLQSIFDPFVQVDSEFTRTASGAGLGLSISRDLARLMGGELVVESTLGVGSTFSLSLRAADVEPTAT